MNILGGGMQILGGVLGAKNADRRAKKLEKLAATPGVDIGSAYSDVTKAGMGALPGAQDLSSGMNAGALGDLTSILEAAIPGWSQMQGDRAGAVGSMLKGEIPTDVRDAVFRKSGSKAVAGGYGGSEFGRNLTSRDLGLTSLDILGTGMRGMSSMLGSTPLPRMTQASDILDVTGQGAVNLRSGERSKMLDMMGNAFNAPRSGDIYAKMLTDMGGSMGGGSGSGAGLGSIMGILGAI